jgi:hypothetical protein
VSLKDDAIAESIHAFDVCESGSAYFLRELDQGQAADGIRHTSPGPWGFQRFQVVQEPSRRKHGQEVLEGGSQLPFRGRGPRRIVEIVPIGVLPRLRHARRLTRD